MTRTLLVLLLLSLMAPAMARVSHVSINKSQFTLGEYPRLRINVVAEGADASGLEFIIRQKNTDEKLMVEQVSPFLLLLTGVEDVTDPQATLIVREYVVNTWRDYKIIPLFGGEARLVPKATAAAATPVKEAAVKTARVNAERPSAVKAIEANDIGQSKATANATATANGTANATANGNIKRISQTNIQPVIQPHGKADAGVSASPVAAALAAATRSAPQPPAAVVANEVVGSAAAGNADVGSAEGAGGCRVEYKEGETLWRIASRYAPDWNSNVYGTMLALFEANPQAFRNSKINGLKDGVALTCPSPALLARYPDTREAKRLFESRQAQ